MGRVADKQNSTFIRDPSWEGIAPKKFVIDQLIWRGMFDDGSDTWIPILDFSEGVFNLAGEGPRFLDVGSILGQINRQEKHTT